jgi:hypothetical protein
MRTLSTLALLIHALAGCATGVGSMSLVSTARVDWPVMVLRPNVEARCCAHSVLFGLVPLGEQEIVGAAVERAVAVMADGEALTDAALELETIDLLLYRRVCARARGTVGKQVRVLHLH